MRFLTVFLSLMIAAVLVANVSAADKKERGPRQTPEERFKALDTNKDNVLSEDEFVKGRRFGSEEEAKERFKKWGGTAEKGLTLEQYKKGWEEMRKEWAGKRGDHKKGEKKN